MNENRTATAAETRAVKSTAIVMMFNIIAMGANLASQSLIANYFGARASTDSYMTAWNISHIIGKLFLTGHLASVFIPVFIEARNKNGESGAWRSSANLFNVLTAMSFALLTAIFIAAPQLVGLAAPAFSPEQKASTVHYLRIFLPVSFFLLVSALGVSVLNALNRFTLPAMAGVTTPLFLIFAMALFARSIGIECLVWGSVAAAVLNFVIYYAALRKPGFRFGATLDFREPATVNTLQLLAPLFANYILVEIANSMYRVYLATGLGEGMISIFNYSNNLYLGMVNVMMLPLMTVIFPPISERCVAGDMAGAKDLSQRCIRIAALTVLPVSLTLAMLSRPVIRILYERGGFTAGDTHQAAFLFSFLAVCLWLETNHFFLYRLFFALKRTGILSAIVIVSTLGQMLLMWLFCRLFGIIGLALGPLVAMAAGIAVFMIVLNRWMPGLASVFADKRFLIAILISAINCAAVAVAFKYLSPFFESASVFKLAFLVFLVFALAAAIQFILIKLFREKDLDFLFGLIRSKLDSKRG